MKRFSEHLPEDREFEVAGEVFKWRYPYWEEIAAIFDEDSASEAEGRDELTFRENIQTFIDRIEVFIVEDDRPRWRALTSRTDNPVPYATFSEIYRWLLGVASGRPTEPPVPSAPGAQTTGRT